MRLLKWLLIAVALLIVVPPLWYKVFPEAPSALPAPGTAIAVVGAQTLNVLDQGNGPVVVLVHGLPGTAYDWRVLAPLLNQAGFRTLAYDRVGYGHSEARNDSTFGVQANSDELRSLLAAVDVADATVVGWSYGGAITMQSASDSRIRRMVLVGSAGPSSADEVPPEPPVAMRVLYSKPVLAWRSAVPPVSRALQAALSSQAFSGGAQPDWWLPDLASNFSRWDTVLSFRNEILAPIDPAGFNPAGITQPTLIVHGDDDRLAPVAIGRYLAEVIPDARYQELAGVSHMLPVTHAEQLASAIVDFVAATP
ncbi:MAG: alpha/beta fold hydrolase [Pseudomonadales bacterium]